MPGIKVARRTRELVRLGSAMEHCTQDEFVDKAVAAFIDTHRDEIEGKLAQARKTLGLS